MYTSRRVAFPLKADDAPAPYLVLLPDAVLQFPRFFSIFISDALFRSDQDVVEQNVFAHRPQLEPNRSLNTQHTLDEAAE